MLILRKYLRLVQELLELSVVDLKSLGTDRLGTEVKLRQLENVFLGCTFKTVRFLVLVVRGGESKDPRSGKTFHHEA